MVEFKVGEVFNMAFGSGGAYLFSDYGNNEDEPIRRAANGAPIYDQLLVRAGTVVSTGQEYGEYVFPDVMLIDASQPHIIIETGISKNDTADNNDPIVGTVKELIALDDWEIVLRGLIIYQESSRVYPKEAVAEMKELLKLPTTLEIENEYLNNLGIYSVVVKNKRFPQLRGYRHAQPFEVVLKSDYPTTLDLDA